MIDYKKFVENSRKWLKEYIQNNYLESIVLGISGGIDSTVSAAIVFPMCKELNIPLIGRSLPTGTNKQCEIDTANLVGEAFCTNYDVVALDNVYHAVESCFERKEGAMTNLQKGNIKARLRMMYLRNLASLYKGVVLDNDNFTEWNLGFWTVGGDSPMDVNLGLHYFWKTDVYRIADYLCNEYMKSDRDTKQSKAIKASMTLIPTDGNGISNTDCEQFGLDSYRQVDDVLKTMYYRTSIDETTGQLDKEYIRLIDSYNEQGVDKVMLLHQNTEYKRKPAPIMPTREELGL